MGEKIGIKVYSCLTQDEQKYYENMPYKKRKYLDFRVQGYDRAAAYTMAGFTGGNPSQCGYNMEHRDKGLAEIIGIIKRDNVVNTLTEGDNQLSAQIDALAKQKKAENVIDIIQNADGETAERIKFFRDIACGKVKSKKVVKEFDGKNKLIKVKVEEIEDVALRIQARKELDRVLGLNQIVDIGKIDMGDITINIVDASNKNALADSRNKVDIPLDKEEVIIEGEEVKG